MYLKGTNFNVRTKDLNESNNQPASGQQVLHQR